MDTPIKRDYRTTVRLTPDLKITVKVTGKGQFTIGAVRLPNGRYYIKKGRGWSKKMPPATLTEIFTQARKFVVRHAP